MRTLAGGLAAAAAMSGCGAATKTTFDSLPPKVRAAPPITVTTTVTAPPASPAGAATPAPATPPRPAPPAAAATPPGPGPSDERPGGGPKGDAKALRHKLRKLLQAKRHGGDH